MGYNPNEPRDAEGKWTDAGDAIRKAASDKKAKLLSELRQIAFDIKVTEEGIRDSEKSIETLKMDTSDYQFKERFNNNLDFIAYSKKELLKLNLKRKELLNKLKNL